MITFSFEWLEHHNQAWLKCEERFNIPDEVDGNYSVNTPKNT